MEGVTRLHLCFLVAVTHRSAIAHAQSGRKITYGKYYSDWGSPDVKNFDDNSYTLFKPPKNLKDSSKGLLPLVIHFYGNGWKLGGGPIENGSPKVWKMLSSGIAVASVGYRRITCHYWYDTFFGSGAFKTPEEFINIDADGRMSLDNKGKTFKDYRVRVARHEMLTKPTYDGVKALEHLISSASKFKLDMHRVFFWAFSAGGTIAQYLTHVYHAWHHDKFTPKGMSYEAPMLDVPTANVLNRVWEIIENNTIDGAKTKLKDLIPKDMCWWTVGSGCDDARFSKWFSPDMPYSTCNSTWNSMTLERYCGRGFDDAIVGDLRASQVWPEDSEYARGLTKIWYSSRNILQHTPKPFHVYLQDSRNAGEIGLLHSPLYSLEFHKLFEKVGIKYAIYYETTPVMLEPSSVNGSLKVHTEKYLSNHGWHDQLASAGVQAGSWTESVLYACVSLEQPTCMPKTQETQADHDDAPVHV